MGPLLKGLLRSLGGSEANFLELCFGRSPYGNFHTKATSKKFRPPSGNFRPNPPPQLPRSPPRSGSSQEAGRKIILTLSALLRRWPVLLRADVVLTKDPKSPYEGQSCGQIDREGSCKGVAKFSLLASFCRF